MTDRAFDSLVAFLLRLPCIQAPIGERSIDCEKGEGWWRVTFSLDIDHPLAWHAVQELGSVLNYVTETERMPTVFKPVSPAPYLSGGPDEYLGWVIECQHDTFEPATCAKWLAARLPHPVEDEKAWLATQGDA